MNILITGCNGFLGQEFAEYFNNGENRIFLTNRNNLDVCNFEQVQTFFDKNKIDVVLHTAVKGGHRDSVERDTDFADNVQMFSNLEKVSDRYKLMITFCSGAAYGRGSIINNVTETELESRHPIGFYGRSKNIIARQIRKNNKNIVNLRLFGCFGSKEQASRLIKTAITRCLDRSPIVIPQNKEMDFFYVRDLCLVIDHYISSFSKKNLPNDVNMCYNERKFTLEEIVQIVCSQNNTLGQVTVLDAKMGNPYTGSPRTLASLEIPLIGLKEGIKEVYSEIICQR